MCVCSGVLGLELASWRGGQTCYFLQWHSWTVSKLVLVVTRYLFFVSVGVVEMERRAATRQHRFVLNDTSLIFDVTGIIGFLVIGKLAVFFCITPD